jgi:hypothetical protein
MQVNSIQFPEIQLGAELSAGRSVIASYEEAEQWFNELLKIQDLDNCISHDAAVTSQFEKVLALALADAYGCDAGSQAAHLFLQRILYQINRLKLFWYDDLQNYENERSLYLQHIRNQIETVWQRWELAQLNVDEIQQLNVEQALCDRAAADLDPPPSGDQCYFRDHIGLAGYQRLLAIASLDGLVEASQLSRMLGGVANEVHAVLTKLLVEEYGAGRLARKHSSYFITMLEELGMQTEPEAYLNLVPWEVLAIVNHSFLQSERKRYFLRYIGGLLHAEISVPAAFRIYRDAAERLGLSERATSYWNLHIKVDQLHGRWMLDEVALPLISQYPDRAWEMVLGYDQQRLMGDRAGAAVVAAAKEADRQA